jgi:hypothetical protein
MALIGPRSPPQNECTTQHFRSAPEHSASPSVEAPMCSTAPAHSETELSILVYIYDHSECTHSTRSLSIALQEPSRTTEPQAAALHSGRDAAAEGEDPAKPICKPEGLQDPIGSLILKGFLVGTRNRTSRTLSYNNIKLTARGEQQATVAKIRPPAFPPACPVFSPSRPPDPPIATPSPLNNSVHPSMRPGQLPHSSATM